MILDIGAAVVWSPSQQGPKRLRSGFKCVGKNCLCLASLDLEFAQQALRPDDAVFQGLAGHELLPSKYHRGLASVVLVRHTSDVCPCAPHV